MKLILNDKVIWENPDIIGHFAIKLRKQMYEYQLVDELIMRAKNQVIILLQRRCEMMEKQEEEQVGLEADGWDAACDREQEVERLARALADKEAELEEARRDLAAKSIQLGECQQLVRELRHRNAVLEALAPWLSSPIKEVM